MVGPPIEGALLPARSGQVHHIRARGLPARLDDGAVVRVVTLAVCAWLCLRVRREAVYGNHRYLLVLDEFLKSLLEVRTVRSHTPRHSHAGLSWYHSRAQSADPLVGQTVQEPVLAAPCHTYAGL